MAPRDLMAAMVVVCIWGFSFVVVKWGLADMPPLFFVTLRFAGVAVLAIWLPRPKIDLRYLLLYGISWGAVQFGCLFLAIHLGMPAGLASVVVQSQAFFTLILSTLLLDEHWRASQLAGLIVSALGLWLIAEGPGGSVPLVGFLLNLVGAIGWAYGNIVVRRMVARSTRTDTVGFVAWAAVAPSVVLALLSLVFEGRSQIMPAIEGLGLHAVLAVGYQAFAAVLAGALIWNRLLSRYPANQVAPFSLLVPCVGLLSAGLLLGEKLTLVQALGSLLTVGGVFINMMGARLAGRVALVRAARGRPSISPTGQGEE